MPVTRCLCYLVPMHTPTKDEPAFRPVHALGPDGLPKGSAIGESRITGRLTSRSQRSRYRQGLEDDALARGQQRGIWCRVLLTRTFVRRIATIGAPDRDLRSGC